MLLETFRGPDLTALFRKARAELGEDALIVRTRVVRSLRRREFEVVTTTPRLVAGLRARVRAFPLPGVHQHRASCRPPYVVALVGPDSSIRASALAALAASVDAFAEWKTGVLTVGTSPSAMLASMATHASLRELEVEVASTTQEVAGAVRRMSGCDAILVNAQESESGARAAALVQDALGYLTPDETHLVLNSSASASETSAAVNAYAATGVSHLLLAQGTDVLDEEAMLTSMNTAGLPVRWVTQRARGGATLQPAAERILGALRQESAGTEVLA